MSNEELILKIQDGTNRKEYLSELCVNNRGLVYQIAKRFQGIAEIEDLAQEGFIGLINASERWEKDRGVSFASYAELWIKNSIYRYLDNTSDTIRFPSYKKALMNQYNKYVSTYQAENGDAPSAEEISDALCISLEAVKDIRRSIKIQTIVSLDAPITDEPDGTTLGECIEATESQIDAVIDKVQHEQLKTALWGIVDDLEPYKRNVLIKRYKEGKTYRQCAEEMSRSPTAIQAAEKNALRELKKPSRRKVLIPFADDFILNLGLKNCGVGYFKHNNTSSTEAAVIRLEELKEQFNIR